MESKRYYTHGVVILGSGIAGVSAALGLRSNGFTGSLGLIGSEPCLPYKRTHLSKKLISPICNDDFSILNSRELKSLGIDYYPGMDVDTIQPDEQLLNSGNYQWFYEHLVLALGAQAILPPFELPGALVLYTKEQAMEIQGRFKSSGSNSVGIVGDGILAVELAVQMILLGAKVTMILGHEYPMHRELPREVGLKVKEFLKGKGITLVDYSVLHEKKDFQFLLWAVGSQPSVQLARAAGMKVSRGILVDSKFRTSVPGLYAVGDCAQLPDGRLSHLWHSAEDQGKQWAEIFCGSREKYDPEIFRTKAEVFDRMIFSCGLIHGLNGETSLDFRNDFWVWSRFIEGKLVGLVYFGPGDKALAKAGQTAVRRGIGLNELRELF